MTKRTFEVLRSIILLQLSKGKKTINQISNETGINWKTVDNHLTYLVGRGLVMEIFSSKYVRIFELTKLGHKSVESMDTAQIFGFKSEEERDDINQVDQSKEGDEVNELVH